MGRTRSPVLRPLVGRRSYAPGEAEHVEVWDHFASAVGASIAAAPAAETKCCVRAWSAHDKRELLASLVVLYAIESSQPRISEVKRAGLIDHYGFEPSSEATAYFELHAVRDHDHAAHHRSVISTRMAGDDNGWLVEPAEEAASRQLDAARRGRAPLRRSGKHRLEGCGTGAPRPPSHVRA